MNKIVLKYLCVCEGWKTACKQLHWNSRNLSQHKLCDDIADRLSDFQDQVGEVEQSISGNLPFNKLKPVPYKIKNLKKFVEDVIKTTNTFYKKVKKLGDKYVGMSSDCESFMSDMQRNLYLVNFTIKEDFKRNYKNDKRMDENKRISSTRIKLSESELYDVINEAVSNVLGSQLNEIGDTEKGQYALGKLEGRKDSSGDKQGAGNVNYYALLRRLEKKPFKDIEGMVSANMKVRCPSSISESCNEAEVTGGEYQDKELNYTHFAVNKNTNLIVDGWDYTGYDTEDLKSDKNGYFYEDLRGNGFNPKAYKILSFKACKKGGFDPNDKANWSNTGVFPLSDEIKMKQDGEDFYSVAYEKHPDWFVD